MRRDLHDLGWGAALALTGLAVAGYAFASYDMGSLRRMGPGFFPVTLGLLLAGLGALIAVPAMGRPGRPRPFAWPETIAVVAALLVFGLALDRLGVLLTTALTVLIASAVAPRRGLGWRLVLTVAVTALVWLVFVRGLNMSLPVWPGALR
ncbi:tripartite tricarboxylate transporter TctB family protein [Paracoccus aestuarii]|uniref:Tripartite tricarboxylate transporter TctB family protein n=1 Tax=Paracoccus aestuarii TaxID=453842 RepID=A0A419A2X3_9RHOB|nr:tripartite tricarboxylate transporter TctB family protein [Paracoccus aestuarii]RJL07504.1 tripartite tricarboxylate transporter TctB family protein [Paracoccus aestuarii]WCQ99074.1 tripartite tricarboxylate transporter TctB family protein [Paracoccus aestuarii]